MKGGEKGLRSGLGKERPFDLGNVMDSISGQEESKSRPDRRRAKNAEGTSRRGAQNAGSKAFHEMEGRAEGPYNREKKGRRPYFPPNLESCIVQNSRQELMWERHTGVT